MSNHYNWKKECENYIGESVVQCTESILSGYEEHITAICNWLNDNLFEVNPSTITGVLDFLKEHLRRRLDIEKPFVISKYIAKRCEEDEANIFIPEGTRTFPLE